MAPDDPELPPIPSCLQRLRRYMPYGAAADVARAIEADGHVAAAVLRVANSAAFSRGQPSKDLVEAVNRLGNQAIHDLVILALVRALHAGWSGAYRTLAAALWRHVLLSSCTAHALARRLRWPPARVDVTFLCGLLHRLGVSVLVRRHARPAAGAAPVEPRVALAEAHGRHVEVTVALLTHWNFDAEQIEVARRQLDRWMLTAPGSSDERALRETTRVIALADRLAEIDDPADWAEAGPTIGACRRALSLNATDCDAALKGGREARDAILASLGESP